MITCVDLILPYLTHTHAHHNSLLVYKFEVIQASEIFLIKQFSHTPTRRRQEIIFSFLRFNVLSITAFKL